MITSIVEFWMISLFPLSIPSPKLLINIIRKPQSSQIPSSIKEIKNPMKYLPNQNIYILIISFAQTVIHVRTVVIKHLHTITAILAMWHPLKFDYLTCWAYPPLGIVLSVVTVQVTCIFSSAWCRSQSSVGTPQFLPGLALHFSTPLNS